MPFFGQGRGGDGGGRSRGGFRRGGSGFRANTGRGGGGSGFNRQDNGPPAQVIPLGFFTHTSQDDLVVKSEIEDVPYFNAPIYLQNKEQIGKIDEIFGTLKDYYVSVKLSEEVKSKSFKVKDKLFIDPAKLLPLKRFLPKPPGADKGPKGPKGGNSGGGRGNRGGGRGGRGGFNSRRGFGQGGNSRGFSKGGGGGGDRRNFGGRGTFKRF